MTKKIIRMKKTLLHAVSDGCALTGILILGVGIGERMGAQQTLMKQYMLSSGATTTEEKREISTSAYEEADREFPLYLSLGRGLALVFAGSGLAYWDSRRERKKREWTACVARE